MNESLRKKIEARAYQLFLKRGAAHGYAAQDWARAEKEILAEEAAGKPSGAPKTQMQAPIRPMQPKKSQGMNKR